VRNELVVRLSVSRLWLWALRATIFVLMIVLWIVLWIAAHPRVKVAQ
jgi:hypothetical protein